MKIVLATGNRSKAGEIIAILGQGAGPDLEFTNLADLSGLPPIVEDGKTFLENARKKARPVAEATGLPALGEDSGLEVEALDGAPGIYSARYAGEGVGDGERFRKLLGEMKDVPPGRRGARFRCVAVLAFPDGREIVTEGVCEGGVAMEPRGSGGFGYDPVFLLPDGRTMAELSPEQKAAVSHRGRAMRRMREELNRSLQKG